MSKFRQMTVFMHVVQLGSITKAAEKLTVSKSVVSQHLKQLEADLGVPLLIRTTRRQQLTSTGEQFYQQCCQMHNLAEQAWADVAQQQLEPQGRLKITAPHALMEHLVVPALSHTFLSYPQVELELICHDGQLDLVQEGIDLAIRVGHSKNSSLKQKRLGYFQDVLCSAPSIFANSADKIHQVSAIQALPYVANHWQQKQVNHQLFNNVDLSNTLDLTFSPQHKANTLPTCINLIEQGFGIGIVPDFILQKHQSSLLQILPDYHIARTQVYALHPYQAAVPTAITMASKAITHSLQG